MSKVYFYNFEKGFDKNLLKSSKRLSKFYTDKFTKNDDLAIKIHFGERESDTHLDPGFVKNVFQEIENEVSDCVLMDCNVLYKGERSKASSHKKLAVDNGFDFAPIVIADGERGENELRINSNGKHFDTVKVGAGLKNYNSLLVISHFTGHVAAGIGGALKNVGMGLGSKAGKLAMHDAFELRINSRLCRVCGACIEHCPDDAIEILSDSASIDHDKCIGCGRCIAECPVSAVKIPWSGASSRELQERIVEYASGVLDEKKAYFINVLVNVTKECDCINRKQNAIVEAIGILASEDPVAIDQASLDLVGEEKFRSRSIDPSIQIKYAEELGLGSRKYKLIKV